MTTPTAYFAALAALLFAVAAMAFTDRQISNAQASAWRIGCMSAGGSPEQCRKLQREAP